MNAVVLASWWRQSARLGDQVAIGVEQCIHQAMRGDVHPGEPSCAADPCERKGLAVVPERHGEPDEVP